MGYAEARGSGRGAYFRARYKKPDGRYGTLREKFRSGRDAKRAADAEEAKIRAGVPQVTSAEDFTFGQFANRWYAGLDLAPSTMMNYRRHLEEHLLVAFQDTLLADLLPADVDAWEKAEHAAGYRQSSVKTWRTTLHTILADAVDAGLIRSNPATKRRGKGKRAGRSAGRGPEKVIADPLQALLVAERAAILSGRDDEFVFVTLMFWTGLRWAEGVGLETRYARLGSIRVEHQLYELPDGLVRCPPKDDSYRDVDMPVWLAKLVSDHIARIRPRPCRCHASIYVFRGRYGGAHWHRSGFGDWIFEPAVSGWFPAKAPQPRRPVPVAAEPWPGKPVRGRNNQGRAEACWLPVAAGLTPHGLRHSHKSLMDELRTPGVLSHDRLGHKLGGIAGIYSHVTDGMRQELVGRLTERWDQALDARLALNPRSSVTVLDGLLQARAGRRDQDLFSQDSPQRRQEGVMELRAKPRKGA
jgi:integrase